MPTRQEIQNMIQNLKLQAQDLEVELDAMPDVDPNEELVPIELVVVEETDDDRQLRLPKI